MSSHLFKHNHLAYALRFHTLGWGKNGATEECQWSVVSCPWSLVVDSPLAIATLTQEVNDKQQLVPVLEEVQANVGRLPEKAAG